MIISSATKSDIVTDGPAIMPVFGLYSTILTPESQKMPHHRKAVLIGIAALFLATGTAHADYIQHHECGEKEIVVKFDSKTDAAIEYVVAPERPDTVTSFRELR